MTRLTHRAEEFLEIHGSRSLKGQSLAAAGMSESQLKRVEHDSWRGKADQFFKAPILPLTVSVITGERIPEMLKVNADLMRATRMQNGFGQRRRAKTLQYSVACPSLAPAVIGHRHPLAMRRMPGNRGPDFAFFPRQFATENCMVDFFHRPAGELRRERQMRFIIFRHDQTAAGFLVEPMNNSRSRHAADAAQSAFAVMQKRVHQGVFLMSRCRMNHNAGWFVQHEQSLVFEQDFQRNFFRLCFGRLGFGPVNLNLFAGMRRVGGFHRAAINADMTFFNQPLDGAAGNRRKFFTQEIVQPLGRESFFNQENFGAIRHSPVQLDGEVSTALTWRSLRQVRINTSPTPVQIALSAILKAGKPWASPLR